MTRTRRHNETSHNHERWLLTYADMITLLTAFFLMMYSMSVMSKGKFSVLASSVRSSFRSTTPHLGGAAANNGGSPGSANGNSARQFEDGVRKINAFVEQHQLSGQVSLRSDERGLVISVLADKMLFERGKAQLGVNSEPVLDSVAALIKSTPNQVQVEGHTDDLPIHTPQFPSNWELSMARAGAVLRYFTDQCQIPSVRFAAAGYADTHPLLPNISEANRSRNRRVDIVLLKSDAERNADLQRRSEVQRVTVSP